MNIEKYLPMDSDELYAHLLSDVMANPSAGERLTEELSKTDRYQNDFEFRILTDTSKATCFFLLGEYSKAIPFCRNLVERARALSMWKTVSNNLNLMGSSYLTLGISKRALEHFQAVIKHEQDHGFLMMTSAAYNNIALLYINLNAPEKACRYFQLALETLEKEGKAQPRYETKLLSYLGYLATAHCLMNQLDQAASVMDRIKTVKTDSVSLYSMYISNIAKMYYAFYTGNCEDARKAFKRAKSLISENDTLKNIDLLQNYINLCIQFQLDPSFYEEDLNCIKSIENSCNISDGVRMCSKPRSCSKTAEKKDMLRRRTTEHIRLLEQSTDDFRIRQLSSLQVVEDLIKENEKNSDIFSRSRELQRITSEALQTKKALQEAYRRIAVINDLGKKITSSLNLSEVIDTIYKSLSEKVPMNSFVLMVAETEHRRLQSAIYYRDGILQPQFTLDTDRPDSVFAECYRTNRMIVSGNIRKDPRFKHRKLLKVGDGDRSESVVFMPLNVDGQIVGICSIQANGENSYTKKHLMFLEELLPYLSISLNNAIRSRRLEKEIQSHLKTQMELQEANRRLDYLSSLDGLTQISNRRDFEKRMISLLYDAKKTGKDITVFMLDIDNFKLYNDTYGHLEGDKILKQTAMTVRMHMDSVHGLSARFGGEEFIAACTGLDKEKSFALAERIRRDIFELSIENKHSVLGKISISIGAATTDRALETTKSRLMKCADLALYQAKNTGKNRVIIKDLSIRKNI